MTVGSANRSYGALGSLVLVWVVVYSFCGCAAMPGYGPNSSRPHVTFASTGGSGLTVAQSYEVTIFVDGFVRFTDKKGVATLGTVTKRIDPHNSARVFDLVDRIDFWSHADSYGAVERSADGNTVRMIFDYATYVITAVDGQRTKRIEAITGARPKLDELVGLIHQVADVDALLRRPAPIPPARR